MNEINYDEKIKTFQLMTENFDHDLAINYLSKYNWDETVIFTFKDRKQFKTFSMTSIITLIFDKIESILKHIIRINYMRMMQ